MKKLLKLSFLQGCRLLGLFWLASKIRHKKFLILCYHGFEIIDESKFRPKLFIRQELFRQRLAMLKSMDVKVVSLQQALEKCQAGLLDNNTIVITIDDGFFSTLSKGSPLLHEYSFPATLYLTSYYFQRQVPVFELAVQYILWKTTLNSDQVSKALQKMKLPCTLKATDNSIDPCDKIVDFAEERYGTETERQTFARSLAENLNVDYDAIESSRMLAMVSNHELDELYQHGVDIQLHTHRHTFPPNDYNRAASEIVDNREALQPYCRNNLEHFCYPSGEWGESSWRALTDTMVKSAVTCDGGWNSSKTPIYALNRFLDSEEISPIEFRAEVTGFSEWLRLLRRTTKETLNI